MRKSFIKKLEKVVQTMKKMKIIIYQNSKIVIEIE